MINELRHRDPLLFWVGAGMLLTLLVVTLLSISDTRLILGINPWIKPMKFLTSIAIFLWTVAWFMPETRPDGRARNAVRWTISTAMVIEIACVILQAARGTTSHFNIATTFDAVIFQIMGITIAINTLAMIWFLTLVRRDTPPSRAGYLWGIRLGLAMFLLASFEGGLIVANNAHTVGGPDGGAGLPFVNWSMEHGDLRIAHFFGMHAMQALPLIGFLSHSRNVVVGVGVIWLAVTGGLVTLALQGRPLLSL
jgi:hypothetical protein